MDSVVLAPEAQEVVKAIANPPFLFELGPEKGRKAASVGGVLARRRTKYLKSSESRWSSQATLVGTGPPSMSVFLICPGYPPMRTYW